MWNWQQDVCCCKGTSHFSRCICSSQHLVTEREVVLLNGLLCVCSIKNLSICTRDSFENTYPGLIAAKFSNWTDKWRQSRALKSLFGFEELATHSLHSWRKAFIWTLYQSPPTVHLFSTPKRILHTLSLCNKRPSATWLPHLSWRSGNKIAFPLLPGLFVAGSIGLFHPPEEESASDQA